MANTSITKSVTKDSAVKKFTFSAWIKRSGLGGKRIFSAYQLSSYWTSFYFSGNDQLELFSYINSSQQAFIQTTSKYKDVNGWYHIVLAVDTTQATASNRVKIYVNGEQQTALNQNSYPTQDSAMGQFNDTGATLYIGKDPNADFDGVMSHVHYTQGHTYAASDFGSTDSTTGEWKINTSPSVTYGTNGFFILKDGNSVTDQSGNSNNFTVGSGTLTKTEDCPSNVFATLNPLYNSGGTVTYSNGNNTFNEGDNQWKTTFSTLGASSGKYYAEFKCGGNYAMIGVADYNVTKSGTADRNFSSTTIISEQGYGIYNGNGDLYYRGSSTSYADTYGNGDIIGVALDCDNNKVFFAKNGVWQNSADPTSAGTGFSMTATNATYVFALAVQTNPTDANFGNGYFGTTAVSSAGTNASNIGIFEYDVPTGYTALSTKGLNE